MPRWFNVSGPCNPADHYMLPVAGRLPSLRALLEQQAYFVLHAPRPQSTSSPSRWGLRLGPRLLRAHAWAPRSVRSPRPARARSSSSSTLGCPSRSGWPRTPDRTLWLPLSGAPANAGAEKADARLRGLSAHPADQLPVRSAGRAGAGPTPRPGQFLASHSPRRRASVLLAPAFAGAPDDGKEDGRSRSKWVPQCPAEPPERRGHPSANDSSVRAGIVSSLSLPAYV